MYKMTEVAEHINAMKKKYDTAIHVQEILSLIRGIEVSSWGRSYGGGVKRYRIQWDLPGPDIQVVGTTFL